MSAATETSAESRRMSRLRRLLWAGLLLSGAAVVVIALIFAWPGSGPDDGRFALGHVDDYRVGSVSTIKGGEFHLVRLSEERFIALSWIDSHLRRCTVPWRPDFVWPDARTGTDRSGWFRDPCSGSTYDKQGRRAFGPSPRDLDRFAVAIVDEMVIVDTAQYVCGQAPPGAGCVEATTPQP